MERKIKPGLNFWCGGISLVTQETEAEGFQVQGLPRLHSKFTTSLDNLVRSYLRIKMERGTLGPSGYCSDMAKSTDNTTHK